MNGPALGMAIDDSEERQYDGRRKEVKRQVNSETFDSSRYGFGRVYFEGNS